MDAAIALTYASTIATAVVAALNTTLLGSTASGSACVPTSFTNQVLTLLVVGLHICLLLWTKRHRIVGAPKPIGAVDFSALLASLTALKNSSDEVPTGSPPPSPIDTTGRNSPPKQAGGISSPRK
jgi:hypothetical protein